ncbi:MAG: OmpA family protein, partial [Bacteroidota bacterium]
RVVEILQDNPSLVVEISSHTDSDATDAYNIQLSQARASGVVEYLLAAGIYADRLEAKGYGESQPIAPNDTKANKQKNRRTEFRVLSWEEAKSRGE